MIYTVEGNKVGNRVNLMINGKLHTKDCGSNEQAVEFYKLVLAAKESPTPYKVEKVLEYLNKNIRVKRYQDFEYDVQEDKLYLKGFNTPIPQEIVATIEDYVENDFPIYSITNFWRLLMANPDKRVRTDLFKFIQKHDFSITGEGYLIVYKTVDYKEKISADLAAAVSNAYIKVKDKWKKSPSKYVIAKLYTTTYGGYIEQDTDEYDLDGYTDTDEYYDYHGCYPDYITEEVWDESVENRQFVEYKVIHQDKYDDYVENNDIVLIGNLAEQMLKIKEINEKSTYTDLHSHSMEIELGVPVKMDRKDCDGDPKNECSYGLHVGATKYVETFRFYRKTPVLVCLVNPMNVVAVPEYDNSKMRVTEYYPFADATVENGSIEIIKQSYFSHSYISHEKSKLQEYLDELKQGNEVRESAKNTQQDFRDISEYTKILESRVEEIY